MSIEELFNHDFKIEKKKESSGHLFLHHRSMFDKNSNDLQSD